MASNYARSAHSRSALWWTKAQPRVFSVDFPTLGLRTDGERRRHSTLPELSVEMLRMRNRRDSRAAPRKTDPMPTIATSELPIPKSWDEFEDICADLFSRIWNDHNTVRYALLGERQNGVDIRGRLPDGAMVGVQCKRKRQWPVVKLTTKDIDDEVAEALNFKPPLSEFTIATTALNAAKLQTLVDAITERHRAKGLFSVHLLGWNELSRRITDHDQLVEKHYGFVALSSIGDRIDEVRDRIGLVPNETARLVADNLGQWGLPAGSPAAGASPPGGAHTLRSGLAEALERDFQRRHAQAMQRSMFPEFLKTDLLRNLANEARDGGAATLSTGLRRTIFLRAARSRALRNDVREAEEFLAVGVTLPGSEAELPARARVAEARGDSDGAIRALRDEKDADCRSVLISVIARHKGDAAALDWFQEQSLSPNHLTPNGVLTLCQIHLRQQNFASVKQILCGLAEAQLRECPYFLFFRGIVRFAMVLPRPEQGVALTGLPPDVRFARSILPDQQLAIELDAARSDLERFLSAVEGPELREAPRLAEAYLTWCDLLHPRRRDAALIQLRSDMADPAKAPSRVQFALAYDADNFDREPLTKYLEKRDALGGLNGDELRAALVLRLHGDDPGAIAQLIAKHRAQFDEGFAKVGIVAMEIQALAMACDVASAKLLLDANSELLGEEGVARLSAEIARAEGADPVAEYKRVYESNKTADTLRLLLGALIQKKEHRAVGPYAEELFALTGDPHDIAAAAQAYANVGDNDNFMRIVEAHPTVKESDPSIASHYAWQLFHRGRIKEAIAAAAELAGGASGRDLNLEVAIALENGDWETLAQPLAAFLEQAPKLGAATLIQAAHLAQASGQGRLRDLIDAAVAKGGDDPNVLIGAYTLVIEEGLDEREPDAHGWFRRALDLSGPEGPVKQFELKELLSQQAEWSEHSRTINEAIAGGEMPLFVAAPGLRATLVDVLLANFIRNAAATDSRKRSAITTFSGRRGAPSPIGPVRRLALDISAVMVLGGLGLLPNVLDAFPEIVVPAGTLYEMFEGRRRIRCFQKSRLRRAQQIRDFIAQKRLKVLRTTANPQDALVREIGPELAVLIHAAQADAGIVVRAAPVPRLGLEEMRDADVSSYASVLTDTHTILLVLHELGAVDQATEETAKQYFAVQDKGWSAPPMPDTKKPLYLDSLSLIYLHTVGLLDAVVAAFDDVYIDSSAEEDAFALIEHDRHAADVLRVIDDIRSAILKAYGSGKVIFGPRWSQADESVHTSNTPTLHLLGDLLGSDAVVFDDRALNKEAFVADRAGQRARIVTSLDIIEELLERKLLSAAERRNCRHRLRGAGACLVPLDAGEIKAAAQRNGQHLSPEFRAIRDSIDLPRLADIPLFPGEIPWFMTVNSAAKTALVEIWKEEEDAKRAAAIADAIYSVYPNPEDWLACWKGQPPPEWIMAVNRILRATLALPFELREDPQTLDYYNEWLERTVFEPMRKTAPESYRAIIEYLKNFVLSSRNDDHGGT